MKALQKTLPAQTNANKWLLTMTNAKEKLSPQDFTAMELMLVKYHKHIMEMVCEEQREVCAMAFLNIRTTLFDKQYARKLILNSPEPPFNP